MIFTVLILFMVFVFFIVVCKVSVQVKVLERLFIWVKSARTLSFQCCCTSSRKFGPFTDCIDCNQRVNCPVAWMINKMQLLYRSCNWKISLVVWRNEALKIWINACISQVDTLKSWGLHLWFTLINFYFK